MQQSYGSNIRRIKPRRIARTAADTSNELRDELHRAMSNPGEFYGYARHSARNKWLRLDRITGGIQPKTLTILAARPKRGKSMLAAGWIPEIAYQAMEHDKVVRVVSLEMQRKSYQRRMAAIMAEIADTKRIKQGMLDADELKRYERALDELSSLPIEYLTNEVDLDEEGTFVPGNSSVTYKDMRDFIRGKHDPDERETFWWVLDHIGLLHDLTPEGDLTGSIYAMANNLQELAMQTTSGLVITHQTKASRGEQTMESVAGSDQVIRNADFIYLLGRPYMDKGELTDEEREEIKDVEPAYLTVFSRDEGGGRVEMLWDNHAASFSELEIEPGVVLPGPGSRK